MAKYQLVIDKDECPKYENVIYKDQCKGCEYYSSFEMFYDQPCINCNYSDKEE